MKMKFFQLAKQLAKKSLYHHQIGAVVVKKNKPIGLGWNKPHKTHPLSSNAFKTVHAELDAILGLSREELRHADIYVYREYKSGSPATSRPCPHCKELLRSVGIKNVYFTSSELGYDQLVLC